MKRTLWLSFLCMLFFIACGGDSSTSASDSGEGGSSKSNGVALSVVKGTLKDSRDGQIYKTVKIGSLTWMAENLNYETENSYCYKDNEANCTKYGRFYTLAEAMKVCPAGWQLPSQTEWISLITAAGGASVAGTKLKSTSGWSNNGNGTDDFSFSALPAGLRECNEIGECDYGVGRNAGFWGASGDSSFVEYDDGLLNELYGIGVTLYYGDGVAFLDWYYGTRGVEFVEFNNWLWNSVRCVKDENSSKVENLIEPVEVTVGSMKDSRDGQTYKTVKIGPQVWMAQNLNYETSNSYCYSDDAANCAKYGRLYTWATAVGKSENACGVEHNCSLPVGNIQGVCPSGWHLPSYREWNALFTTVGGKLTAGKVLKSTSGWNNGGDGTDSFSFSALPSGYRDESGKDIKEGDCASFWSSTEYDGWDSYGMGLYYSYDEASVLVEIPKNEGYSVRCLKNDASVENVVYSPSVAKASSSSVAKSSSSVKAASSNSVPSSSSKKMISSSSVVKSSSSVKATSSNSVPLSSSEKKISSSSVAKSSSSSRHSGLDSESSSSAPKSSSSSVKVTEPTGETVGSMTDYRDGQTYKTVQIGTQIWMAQNLNYETTDSYCSGNIESNCTNFGRLYSWVVAMDSAGTWGVNGKGCGYKETCSPTYPVRGVCPEGWHLPTQAEWNTLIAAVGGSSTAGTKLKSSSGWYRSGNGTDEFSFTAWPDGFRDYNGSYRNKGNSANFWSSTEENSFRVYVMTLYYGYVHASLEASYKNGWLSVRCLKN